jgi:N-carbamoyl-L-amino-acid hydrolase
MNDRDPPAGEDRRGLRINGQRLWDSADGAGADRRHPKGGVCRLTLTDLDKQGRDLVSRWAGSRHDGHHRQDRQRLHAPRRPQQRLPPVVTGSHIDTQPTGGKFDGNYGVLAGIEVVRTLNDHGIETEAPIEVAFWTNEEGSRFVPVMMGSGVFAKAFTLEHAYAAKDTEGKTVKDELERIGYIGTEEPGDHPIGAYFETHIEQGPVLEDNDKTIGVVTACWASAGTTAPSPAWRPTPARRRWRCARTRCRWPPKLMQEVVACALRHKPHGRGTVGMVQVHPNSRNVIPGRVKFSIDLRNATDALSTRWMPTSAPSPPSSAPRAACRSRSRRSAPYPAQAFHTDCVDAVAALRKLGYSHMPAGLRAPATTPSTWRSSRRPA